MSSPSKPTIAASVPIVIGPANSLAVTGHAWRYVREVLARIPGVRVIRSGDRIVGVIAADVERHAGRALDATPLDTQAVVDEPEAPAPVPDDVDGVLAILGHRRRAS